MMKAPTFYLFVDDRYNIVAGPYDTTTEKLKEKHVELARKFPGKSIHLMKRITTAIANDINWTDSE